MSALASAFAETDAPPIAGTVITTKEHDDGPKNAFLPLTAKVDTTTDTGRNDALNDSLPVSHDAPVLKNTVAADSTTGIAAKSPESKVEASSVVGTSEVKFGTESGRERAGTSSSIWSTAAATLKNLVIGKPQPPPTGIVTIVPAPATTGERKPIATSLTAVSKVDKGNGKAISLDEGVLLLNDGAELSSLPPHHPKVHSKHQPQNRPSAPPARLSSIAHSLPTSHATVPQPPSAASTASPSIQSPQSVTSNATATSATTATDEENQAAALAALNAVIHSVGTGYTQPLTTRAAQLHANDLMLAQQREKLLHTTNLLAKDTAALQVRPPPPHPIFPSSPVALSSSISPPLVANTTLPEISARE